jgi:hypothetical protein
MNINYEKKYLKYKTKFLNFLNGGTTENKCSLCLESLIDDDNTVSILTCCHKFHTKCIKQWFCTEEKKTCPICRALEKEYENFCNETIEVINSCVTSSMLDNIKTIIEQYEKRINMTRNKIYPLKMDNNIIAERVKTKLNIIFILTLDKLKILPLKYDFEDIELERIHSGVGAVPQEQALEITNKLTALEIKLDIILEKRLRWIRQNCPPAHLTELEQLISEGVNTATLTSQVVDWIETSTQTSRNELSDDDL